MSSNIPCHVTDEQLDPFEPDDEIRCVWCGESFTGAGFGCERCRSLIASLADAEDPFDEACGVATGAADERLVAP